MPQRKKVNLALQGGGAHGSFTWGVLDRLLNDDRLEIEAISGTRAGAMNAVVAADGIMNDGYDGARKALWNFWKAVSVFAFPSPYKMTFYDIITGNWKLDLSPGYLSFDLTRRIVSPYDLNPLNNNPFKNFLAEQIYFERVRSSVGMKLFIAATSVQTGRVRIFDRSQLTAVVIMASACLPYILQLIRHWCKIFVGE